jgi:hypothetical protein
MTQKIQKFTTAAVAGTIAPIEIPENTDIFAVLQDGNDISLYGTVDTPERPNEVRTFVLVKTGADLPEHEGEKLYLGSVSFVHAFERNGVGTVRDTPFELHVWEIGPPEWQSRPRLERIDIEVRS